MRDVVAVTLDRFEAEALGVKAGSPAIVLTRTVYDEEGGVVELARDVYRGDRDGVLGHRVRGGCRQLGLCAGPQSSRTPWRRSSVCTAATLTVPVG